MLLRALERLDIPFHLLRSRDIAYGALGRLRPPALIVPGGWASRKAKSLGSGGREEIRSYVARGGQYLGFCGGAGLALRTEDPENGLGICPWGRKPLQERLPNCSGHVKLRLENGSDMCPDAAGDLEAPVWWPAQFDPHPLRGPRVLATYADPGEDFWVADTPAAELDRPRMAALERAYGINLDPEWLRREPAMILGGYGAGSYLLTYLHLETPGSPQANNWLARILQAACPDAAILDSDATQPEWHPAESSRAFGDAVLDSGRRVVENLIRTGEEHLLLTWRKPWLLGWRRGMPGFALNTLFAMVCRAQEPEPTEPARRFWAARRQDFSTRLEAFASAYQALLRKMHQRQAACGREEGLQNGIEQDKLSLVGPFPGQGGLFAGLAEDLQELIAVQARSSETGAGDEMIE
jgi:hypothetical protein